MEDESDVWMIQEYPSSKENNTTRLRWILNKGFGLGKKVVITGVVMSSAPVVLPPLVVISAIGFAFSVPFGLVFASYACTEKLMSKLLPTPTTSLMFEFETDSSEEEVGFEGELFMEEEKKMQMEDEMGWGIDGDQEEEVHGGGVVSEEEQEQIEDTKRVVDMRIELDGPGSEELQGDYWKNGDEYWPEGIDNYENEPMEVTDGSVAEKGYADDVEYLENEEPLEGLVAREEADQWKPVMEESEKLQGYDLKDGDEYQREGIDNYEEEPREVKEESEKEEGKDEKASEDKNVKLEKLNGEVKGVDGGKNDVMVSEEKKGGVEETEKAFEDNNKKLVEVKGTDGKKREDSTSEEKKLNGKVKRKRGKKRGKTTSDERKLNGEAKKEEGKKRDETTLDEKEEIPEKRAEEKAGNVPNEVKEVEETEVVAQGNRDAKNAENIVLAGKPIEDPNVVQGESIQVSDESITEEQKPVIEKKSDYSYVPEDLSSEKKENTIHQNANAREAADVNGFDLDDARRAEGDRYSERLGENEVPTDSTREEIADFLELPVSKGPESKDTEIASETDEAMPSNEALLTEDKLWQQIDAMRAIVGYKAAHDPTFIGELKALYIFTGVEPPPSFKNPLDLAEVNEKLRFLMSVVGVK